jgi:PAS domain S-box-containing protein
MTADTELLKRAVSEAARLLESDGAMVYLVDDATGELRFAHDAGIRDPKARKLIRNLTLPVGVGMFGTAVARGELTITDDYPNDPRFTHSMLADEIVELADMRSMAVAPLTAEGRTLGALGAFSSRRAAFSETQTTLLRALADHAAGAIANQRLVARLAESEQSLRRQTEELAHRVESQDTLRRIAARITAIREADEVLQAVVDAAVRLLGPDGAHLTLRDPDEPVLRPYVMSGGMDDVSRAWLATQEFPIGGGMNGLAAQENAAVWTRDYLDDPRIPHTPDDHATAERMGLRGMAAAPLRAPRGEVIGTLAISYRQPREIAPDDVGLLQALADIGAIAIANARLNEQLVESEQRSRQQAVELARVVEVQRALGEISRRIVEIADASEVLQQVVDAARTLLGSDGAHLTLLNDDGSALIPMVMADNTAPDAREWLQTRRFPVGGGINGLAAASGTAIWTDDYANDPRIPHDDEDEAPAWLGLGAVAVAPLHGPGGEVIGTLSITYREPRRVDPADVALLEELADQGAIAARNARLYTELRDRTDELARVAEAQRTLAGIATQISSIRDPATVLRQTIGEARRLLGADSAVINQYEAGSRILQDLGEDSDPLVDAVPIPAGQGIAGAAIAAGSVRWTGDYLSDASFPHVAAADEWMHEHGYASQMSAPLVGESGPLGALTVYSRRPAAFAAADAELLGALAAQAAVAITNARLYEQQHESERRYRHLVDHSPDLVWAVDADGRFTYVGESFERVLGYRPDELLGKHWATLTEPDTRHIAEAGWNAVVEHPDEDQQIRIYIPLAAGGFIPAEINMIGTMVEGRFAGAHGSIRDIRERERLEEDLRHRSAELAANEERANLARELHDSVTQALFSMGLTVRALELQLDRDPAAAREKLAELRDLQKDALAEMRNLIFELRPRGLEADGLPQAIRTHAAAVEGRTGLAVTVQADLPDRLPLDVEEALYRITQEALHNVVKHANASSAWIVLARTGREIRLSIEDDGIGFDPESTPRGHLGLVGMRQRAERIGATLEVGRRPSGGTQVRVRLSAAPVVSAE